MGYVGFFTPLLLGVLLLLLAGLGGGLFSYMHKTNLASLVSSDHRHYWQAHHCHGVIAMTRTGHAADGVARYVQYYFYFISLLRLDSEVMVRR